MGPGTGRKGGASGVGEVTEGGDGQVVAYSSKPTTPKQIYRVFELVKPFSGFTEKAIHRDAVSTATTTDVLTPQTVTTKTKPSISRHGI